MRAATLRCTWRQRTLEGAWSSGEDWWWTSAVDAVSDILASHHGDAPAACEALGRERADAGIFLDETRADVQVLASVASVRPAVASAMVDAVTLGWVGRTLDLILGEPRLDPLTELAPIGYLAARLHEVHAEALLHGLTGDQTHTLVVVRTRPTRDRMVAETRMITVQTALRYAFRGGESLARTGPATAAALALREPGRLGESLAVLRTEIAVAVDERRLPPTRVWLEPVPAQPTQLAELLAEING